MEDAVVAYPVFDVFVVRINKEDEHVVQQQGSARSSQVEELDFAWIFHMDLDEHL
jgi:hypothetical protein